MLHEEIKYDADTGEFGWLKPRQGRSGEPGSINDEGYKVIQIDGKRYLGHRLAWLLHYGEEPPAQIDHINRDRSDNRIENLRDGGDSVNQMNRSCSAKNETGVTGVLIRRHKKQKPYYYVKFNGEMLVAYTKDFFEAVCARKSAENDYWATV